MRVVIALGGNALLRRGEPLDATVQRANVKLAAEVVAEIAGKHQVVLTHGNGPQVGSARPPERGLHGCGRLPPRHTRRGERGNGRLPPGAGVGTADPARAGDPPDAGHRRRQRPRLRSARPSSSAPCTTQDEADRLAEAQGLDRRGRRPALATGGALSRSPADRRAARHQVAGRAGGSSSSARAAAASRSSSCPTWEPSASKP